MEKSAVDEKKAEKTADNSAAATQGGDVGETDSAQGQGQGKKTLNSGTQSVQFNKYIEIFSQKRLKQYSYGPNEAFEAISREQGDASLIAIVCAKHVVPRRSATAKYKILNNPNLATLVTQGVVYWPDTGEERYVFLYSNTLGSPLLSPGQDAALGWKPDEVMELVVKPMVNVFQDFKDRDFVHGAIRPENMFDGTDGGNRGGRPKKVMLGDCFSLPPSYSQSVLYEPIERAMTDPVARGLGTRADDLYAFGVSLAVIMRLSDPMRGLSSEDVIRRKLELGTYAAITGKDRFKGEILELLRGLLHDDPTQRWTIAEVLVWMDGRRLSPKQALVRKKAPRPFSFMDNKYFLMPRLAMAFEKSPVETRRVVEDESLLQWLERSLDDEEAAERMEKALVLAKEGGVGQGYPERLVAYVSAALDTFAPLRYKNMRVMGDGFGGALAEAFMNKRDVNSFIEVISSSIMISWLSFHENKNIDITGLYTRYEQCRRFVRSKKTGEGIERCLYLLSKECPCLSDMLEQYFVTTPDKLLRSYEVMCQSGKAPVFFIDRHVAAFLMEKDAKVIEQCIYDLNSGEKHRIILANLRCMADIQSRYDVGRVPAVAKAFGGLTERVCERFYDRRIRDKIEKGVIECSASGDLGKMLALLDDPDVVEKDAQGYKKARIEYKQLEKEAAELEEELKDRDNYGVDTGREWAAIASFFLALAVVIFGALSLLGSGG